jgi:hypothetical protein
MGDCYLQGCNRDHLWTPGYPGGCPFFGKPGRPRPQPEETLSVSERLHVQRRDAQLQRQAEAEVRDREWAKTRAVLDEILAEHRAEVAVQLDADLATVRDLVAGQRAAEQHEERELIRRLRRKLDRWGDRS